MKHTPMGQLWWTTTEGLSDGMTVLVTVDYNSVLTRDVLVVYAEQTGETYRFRDPDGSCFYFENPRTTDNFAVVAWQPLPEPYDPNHPNDTDDTRGKTANGKTFILGGLREFGSENG